MRARILFVGESVTLAHVARPIALAQALDPSCYDRHVAFDPRFRHVVGEVPGTWHPLRSIAPELFLAALARGRRIYELPLLREYVADDLALIERVRPDVVIGDFRLSLAVSARLAGVRYVALANATWSPYARPRYAVPDLPLTRVGLGVAQAIFDRLRPYAFAAHCCPFNKLQRQYGLEPLGYELPRIYTEGDFTLYADAPELVPTYDRPPHHQYLGPIEWSPTVAKPRWWNQWPDDRARVYLSLGSSGKAALLEPILTALAELPVWVMVATGGHHPAAQGDNVALAPYLPGREAARASDLVICNGGSPTTYQGLSAGVPVLGIPSNLDQHLNMYFVEQAGVGTAVRGDTLDPAAIRTKVERLLEADYRRRATQMQQQLRRWSAEQRFNAFLAKQLELEPFNGPDGCRPRGGLRLRHAEVGHPVDDHATKRSLGLLIG